MAKLIALYRHPQDPDAFEAHFFDRHVAIARRMAGLRAFSVSAGPVASQGGASEYFLVSQMTFDSMKGIQKALASPEGQAAGADLARFAQAGVDLLVFDEAHIPLD